MEENFPVYNKVYAKRYTDQEEHCSQKSGLDIHVQIQGEGDSKVVGIGKQLLAQSRPLLGDTPNIRLLIRGVDLRNRKLSHQTESKMIKYNNYLLPLDIP